MLADERTAPEAPPPPSPRLGDGPRIRIEEDNAAVAAAAVVVAEGSEQSEEGGDIVELFGDIDWTNANLGELEQQWRAELAGIEEVCAACAWR